MAQEKSKVKIAYYASSVLTIHDYRFLKKLSETKDDVCLITFCKKLSDIPKSIRDLDNLEVYFGDILYYRNGNRECNKLANLVTIIKRVSFLRKVLNGIKPDLVHSGFIQASSFEVALSGYRPFLAMAFGTDILINPYTSWMRRLITRFTLRRAAMVYSSAEAIRKKVLEISGIDRKKTVVFPQIGIDLGLFKLDRENGKCLRRKFGISEDEIVLIMSRNLKPIYGIDYFTKAVSIVVKKKSNIRVFIAGDGPERENYEKLVKELGLDKRVIFLGHVDNEKLPGYYNASDIYVSSSLSDGSSLSLMEAFACGLPVVVSDLPANREWVEDEVNGYVVPKKNPELLAGKILELADSEGDRKRIGKLNRKIAEERADWNINFKKLQEVYHKSITDKSPL